MKREKFLENSIEELKLANNISSILIDNNIKQVKDLWELKRKDLKDLKFSDSEINQITIKLQLGGLDLNRKIY